MSLHRWRLALLAGVTLIATGCLGGSSTPSPKQLTVLAAASLQDVLAELVSRFEDQHPDVEIVLSLDASSTLRAQVEAGAEADLFLSADTANPQALADAGLTDGDPVVFTRNAVTLVVPADNPAGIESWTDLSQPGVRIVAAGEDVPITRYADEAIAALASLPDAPPDFADVTAAAIVSREDNVRAVLAKIELGEGDAAFVYVTDATSTEGVLELPLPAEATVTATYAGTVLRGAVTPGARELMTWLTGEEAQAIFATHGFASLL